MVTQAPGANRILSQPVQHMLDPREPAAPPRVMPPTILHAPPPQVTDLYAPPTAAGPLLRPPLEVQQVQPTQVLLNQCARPLPPTAAQPPPIIQAPQPPQIIQAPPPVIAQAPPPPPESPGDDQFTLDGIEFSPRLVDTGLATPLSLQLSDFQAVTGQTLAVGSEVRVQGEEKVLKEDVGAGMEKAEKAGPEGSTKVSLEVLLQHPSRVEFSVWSILV